MKSARAPAVIGAMSDAKKIEALTRVVEYLLRANEGKRVSCSEAMHARRTLDTVRKR